VDKVGQARTPVLLYPPATRACESTTAALFVTAITMSSKDFDVEYVAELARIKLTQDEINTFESQLGQVLEHVAKLNELDVSQVEPMAHSFPIYNVFREDELRESLDREAALANAPHQAQGLFIVTKVVE
jgi:aspartyl-tRNA(Asn)/glutamyl-tRNA(Gln) amidotransferase subunit C